MKTQSYGYTSEEIIADSTSAIMGLAVFLPFGNFTYGQIQFEDFGSNISLNQTGLIYNENMISEKTPRYSFWKLSLWDIFFVEKDDKDSFINPQNFSTQIEIMRFWGILSGSQTPPICLPEIYLGYYYYEPDPMGNKRFNKKENQIFADLFYNHSKYYYLKSRLSVNLNNPYNLDKLYFLKESLLEIGFNHQILDFSDSKIETGDKPFITDENLFFYYIILGGSTYTDYRLLSYGSNDPIAYGYFLGIKLMTIKGVMLEINLSKNYSSYLRKITEIYNHSSLNFSAQIFF
jgi:hypothetical protein